MPFDPTKLPERKWLKLSEVVNFLALEETQDITAMYEVGSPSDRLYSIRAEQARIRCLDEAGTDPKHTPFAKAINSPGIWNVDPLAPHLAECKSSWTPSGQCLFDLVVEWEHARGKEIERREAARTQVEHWFASGKVVFNGHRLDEEGQDMGLERIGAKSSEEIGIFWEGDIIRATTRATTLGITPPGTYRAQRVWDRVCIKRASLISYLSGGPGEPEENAPVELLPDAFALDVDASAPATGGPWTPTEDATVVPVPPMPRSSEKGRTSSSLNSAREAIAAVYPDGIPKNIRATRRNDEINDHLKKNKRDTVSPRTINRAMKAP